MKGRTSSLPKIEVHIPHITKLHDSRKSSPLNLHKIDINNKNFQTERIKDKYKMNGNKNKNKNKNRFKNNLSMHLLNNNSIMNPLYKSDMNPFYPQINLPKITIQRMSPKGQIENNTFKTISTQYNLDFKALVRKSFAEAIELNPTIKKSKEISGPFLISMKKYKSNLLPFLETNFEDQYREQDLFLNIRKINFPILSKKLNLNIKNQEYSNSNHWRPKKRGSPPNMYKYSINIEEYLNYSPFKDKNKDRDKDKDNDKNKDKSK